MKSLFSCIVFLVLVPAAANADDLAHEFATPPDAARPWVYWFRMDGQIDRDDITRDLEEMRAKGIGGFLQWDNLGIGANVQQPVIGVRWLSPQWWELFRHTVGEAQRLGLQMSVQLCWNVNCGGPWITPDRTLQTFTSSETTVVGPTDYNAVLPKPPTHMGFYRDIAVLAFRREGLKPEKYEPVRHWIFKSGARRLRDTPRSVFDEYDAETPGQSRAALDSIVVLTEKMDADGRLRWQAPPGKWTVLRIGHTVDERAYTLGREPPDLGGLEVNYLDREAMDLHFRELAAKLIAAAGPAAGRTLHYLHTDSWEIAPTRWTEGFANEFRRRRGYDPLPYLPTLFRELVESRELTNRFFWDYRRTLADLTVENHFGRFRELAEKAGLELDCEAGGPYVMSLDALECLGRCDAPMGEIWVPSQGGDTLLNDRNTTKQAASAAHTYGRRLVAAEACTSIGPHWEEAPAQLKPIVDLAFCNGVNRLYLHTFTHSPAAWGKPGLEYFAGSHHNRNVTWWERSGPWLRYLARCQYMLQRGKFVADVCYFCGEGAPRYLPARGQLRPGVPEGYDYDGLSAELLLTALSVQDGRLVLPSGMSYRLLVLPATERMTPAVLARVKRLVDGGAVVLGPTKPIRSPSLMDYPKCDADVARLAAELWDSKRIIADKSVGQALQDLGLPPDFEADAAAKLDYIHRRDRATDIYFVRNTSEQPTAAKCLFRVARKRPEIWDAVSGDIRPAKSFRQESGETAVPLEFGPYGSLFIVFREQIAADENGTEERNFPQFESLAELAGPWSVKFDPRLGGPKEPVLFERLVDWAQCPEEEIKYYSGAAVYRRRFDLPTERAKLPPGEQLFLNLGEVRELATVKLNGRELGTLWCPPWLVEITTAVKPSGNELEIEVINLWPNRLIGDGRLPPEKRLTRTNITRFDHPPKKGFPNALLPSGLLGPVSLQTPR